MLVSSDFLGYLNRKKEIEKRSGPLVAATLKASPGGKQDNPSVEKIAENKSHGQGAEAVEYLNDRPSTLNVIL